APLRGSFSRGSLMLGSRIGLVSLAVLAMLGAGGCSFFSGFPVAGPTSEAIVSRQSEVVPYHLVKPRTGTIDILAANEPKGLAGAFTDQRPSARIVFGIGDVV